MDNERRFDQDVLVFRQVGEKMLAVQMGVRRGVLLGKKEFTVDLQPQIEQEFLKAFYTTNIDSPRNPAEQAVLAGTIRRRQHSKNFFRLSGWRLFRYVIPRRADKLALVQLAEKNLESSLEVDSALG